MFLYLCIFDLTFTGFKSLKCEKKISLIFKVYEFGVQKCDKSTLFLSVNTFTVLTVIINMFYLYTHGTFISIIKYLCVFQLLDVYDILPFDNPNGGAWKQGFEIRYQGNEWDEQPLELFLVPHSHNDPGERQHDDVKLSS